MNLKPGWLRRTEFLYKKIKNEVFWIVSILLTGIKQLSEAVLSAIRGERNR